MDNPATRKSLAGYWIAKFKDCRLWVSKCVSQSKRENKMNREANLAIVREKWFVKSAHAEMLKGQLTQNHKDNIDG